jgi:hypothetical protein
MIPDRAIQLMNKDGFIKAYYEGIRAGQGCKVAFEAVNDEYSLFFGKPRYSGYYSFAQSRDYEQRKFRKQAKKLFKP